MQGKVRGTPCAAPLQSARPVRQTFFSPFEHALGVVSPSVLDAHRAGEVLILRSGRRWGEGARTALAELPSFRYRTAHYV
jgi:hypothetical protein